MIIKARCSLEGPRCHVTAREQSCRRLKESGWENEYKKKELTMNKYERKNGYKNITERDK